MGCMLVASTALAESGWPDLSLRSADGANSIELHGVLQTEAGTGAGKGDTSFRRARVNVAGKLARDFYYKAENDWAVGNLGDGTTDLYLGYNLGQHVYVQGGQFKTPFNLENLGSNRFTTLNERASVNGFAPGRRTGAMLGLYGAQGMHHANAMFAYTDGGIGVSRDTPDTQDATARFAYAQVPAPSQVLHAGLAASYRTPDNDAHAIAYAARPESRFGDGVEVDTGDIADTDHAMQWGLEAAGVWGPLSLQGEAMRVDVARRAGIADSTFSGYYAEASYYLTGEHRKYLSRRGVFDRTTPLEPVSDGGIGAWQVAGRVSGIDLTDGPVQGGDMRNVTLGLNWQPERQVIFKSNVVFVNTDATAPEPNADPTLFMLRMQVDF